MPNPNPVGISVLLEGGKADLTLRIYSKSMRLLSQSGLQAQGPGWVSMPIPAEFLAAAAAGGYFYRVSLPDGQGAKPGNFVVIK